MAHERRQGGLSEEELDRLAERLFKKAEGCSLTVDEQAAVRSLLKVKQNSVKAVMTVAALVLFWGFKDFIFTLLDYIKTHIVLR